MAWFLALASKMIGKEIPMILEVGMAPGGKIKKPKEEVEEYLQHFLIIADAMAKNDLKGFSGDLDFSCGRTGGRANERRYSKRSSRT